MSEGPPRFVILDLDAADEETIGQAANLLVEGFRDDWPEAWPTEEEALEECGTPLEKAGSAGWPLVRRVAKRCR